jgi:hypothetical protein
MASRVVSQLWPTLMPSTSPRRMSFRIKSGVKPLSFEASVTEISSGARSFKGAILVSAVAIMTYGKEPQTVPIITGNGSSRAAIAIAFAFPVCYKTHSR